MIKKALITGIFGQDGSYLCELLTTKGYEVFGIVRSDLSENSQKIKAYLAKKGVLPKLFNVDLNNYEDLKKFVLEIKPDEIYHVAAFHVSAQGAKGNKDFFEKELFDYNVKSTSNILSICYDFLKDTKIILAGSCLMFDNSNTQIQNENTPYESKSLYGLAKIAENSLAKYYRNKGLHASTAILYNHESSRRSNDFVTKKIVKNFVAIKKGEIEKFTLGNLDTKKDWGYSKDYALGMYLMAQQDRAKDFVLATGENHTIKDFIEIVAKKLDLNNWQNLVEIDDKIIDRKIQTNFLGDWNLAKAELNWKHSINLEELIELMIKNEFSGELE